MKNLVFLGAPGAGKGTYAARVSARFSIPAISTGEILRQAVRSGTPLGQEVKAFVEGGKLVPDDVMARVLAQRLTEPDCAQGFILDGYPRTFPQAKNLDAVLKARGTSVSCAVAVEASEELLQRRLGGRRSCPKCGASYNIHTLKPAREGLCDHCGSALIVRPDDQPETIRKRLDSYHAQIGPLIEEYRRQGVLRPVDGGLPLETVVDTIAGFVNGAA